VRRVEKQDAGDPPQTGCDPFKIGQPGIFAAHAVIDRLAAAGDSHPPVQRHPDLRSENDVAVIDKRLRQTEDKAGDTASDENFLLGIDPRTRLGQVPRRQFFLEAVDQPLAGRSQLRPFKSRRSGCPCLAPVETGEIDNISFLDQ